MKLAINYLLFLMVCSSCMSHHTERIVDINPQGWNSEQSVEITHFNADTVSTRDMYVLLRTDDTFKGDSFACELTISSPSGKVFSEQVELNLANNSLTNSLSSGMKDYKCAYRENIILSDSGDYVISFTPRSLAYTKGLWAIGIKIE